MLLTGTNDRRDMESYLTLGIFVSLLVHLLLVLLLSKQPPAPQLEPLVVDIVLDEALIRQKRPEQNRQMVSLPDKIESTKTPDNPRFLAEKDVSVSREQVRRGDGQDAGPQVGKPAQVSPQGSSASKVRAPSRPQTPQAPQASTRKPLRHLTLDTTTLIEEFANSQKANEQPKSVNLNNAPVGGPQPFSRPSGSGARIFGATGSTDYLPNLPDGDITLLNAKANRFAVFVRRVATRVFGELRSSGWERLSRSDIRAMNEMSVVRAVLSPSGELLSVNLESASGSARFDDVLTLSAKKGASDPHPPKEAVADDGNIHFIFQSRTWSQTAPGGRGGVPTERRWILLATGLE